MLNWDDYGKEDNTTPQSSPQIDNEVVKKTAEAVAEEKSVTQQAVKEETPQANTNIGEGSRAEAARKAVNALDETAGNEELDEMMANAGRVQVDQKMMINCKADLNQLVPFKYDLSLIHI